MEFIEIASILGLLLLAAILIILVKREKSGRQDSRKITVWQALMLVLCGGALTVLLIAELPDIIDGIVKVLFAGWGP